MKKSLLTFCLFFLAITVYGVTPAVKGPSGDTVLKVGYIHMPPFTDISKKVPEGFVIDLWDYVIRTMDDQRYTLIDAGKNYNLALKKLTRGDYDVLIGNISLSSERQQWVDFSAPFLLNQSALVVPLAVDINAGFLSALSRIVFGDFGLMFLMVFVMVVVISFAYAFSQRKFYKKSLLSRSERVEASLWVTILAIVSGEVTNVPQNKLGKFIIIIACSLGIVFLSLLGATFTTSLLHSQQEIDTRYTLAALKNKKILVQEGSIQNMYVKDIGAIPVEVGSVREGYKTLSENPHAYAGFSLDYTLAKYTLDHYPYVNLKIAPTFMGADLLSFAVPHDSPYAKGINSGFCMLLKRVSFIVYVYVTSPLIVLNVSY